MARESVTNQELWQFLEDLEVGLALRLDAIQKDLDAIKARLGTPAPLDPEFVAECLGLTPTEGRVAVALAEGNTVREIAAAMGSQVNTIRWHLKMIRMKADAKTQAQVVQRVLLLPHGRGGEQPPTNGTNPKRTP